MILCWNWFNKLNNRNRCYLPAVENRKKHDVKFLFLFWKINMQSTIESWKLLFTKRYFNTYVPKTVLISCHLFSLLSCYRNDTQFGNSSVHATRKGTDKCKMLTNHVYTNSKSIRLIIFLRWFNISEFLWYLYKEVKYCTQYIHNTYKTTFFMYGSENGTQLFWYNK